MDEEKTISENISSEILENARQSLDIDYSKYSVEINENNGGNLEYIFKKLISNYLTEYFLAQGIEFITAEGLAGKTLEELSIEKDTLPEDLLLVAKNKIQASGLGFDSQNITHIRIIPHGILVVKTIQDSIYIDLSAKSLEKVIISKQAKANIEDLQEDILLDKIAFIGGMSALLYPQLQEGVINLKSVTVPIEGYQNLYIGEFSESFSDKAQMQRAILTRLEEKGVQLNPETLKFEKINGAGVTYLEVKNKLSRYTYSEYKSSVQAAGIDPAEIFTKEEFKQEKIRVEGTLGQINTEYVKEGKGQGFMKFILKNKIGILEKLGGKTLHFIMFPIFFKAIHKESGDLGSYFKSAFEYSAFMTGAKIGGKIPGPFIIKMISGIVTGGAFIVGGEAAGEIFFDASRNFTKNFPDREDFAIKHFGTSGAKDVTLHMISGGILNDVADGIGMDIGLYGSETITFFRHNIDLSMDPRVHLIQRGQTEKDRNKKIDSFKNDFEKGIRDIFDGDSLRVEEINGRPILIQNHEYYMASTVPGASGRMSSYSTKTDILKEVYELIADKNHETPVPKQNGEVINYLSVLIASFAPKIASGEESIDTLINICLHEIDKVKIDKDFLDIYRGDLDLEDMYIKNALSVSNSLLINEAPSFQDLGYVSSLPEKERKFIGRIYKRTLNKSFIVDTPYNKMNDVPENMQGRRKVTTQRGGNNVYKSTTTITKEQDMWESLISDERLYIGILDIEEKAFLEGLFIKFLNKRIERGMSIEADEKELMIKELTDILQSNTFSIRDAHGLIKQFLDGVLHNRVELRRLTGPTDDREPGEPIFTEENPWDGTFRVAEGYTTLKEISEKINGGEQFYHFYLRIIEHKRKRDFLRKTGFNLQAKEWRDELETGKKITYEGQPNIIAKHIENGIEIKYNDKTVIIGLDEDQKLTYIKIDGKKFKPNMNNTPDWFLHPLAYKIYPIIQLDTKNPVIHMRKHAATYFSENVPVDLIDLIESLSGNVDKMTLIKDYELGFNLELVD